MAKITYDPETDILYIRMVDGREQDVLEAEDAELYVGEEGRLLAVEVWNASKNGLDAVIKALTLNGQSLSGWDEIVAR